MITVNGKDYVRIGSSEDNGLYENRYYEDTVTQVYNIKKDGQNGTLTKISTVYKEVGTDVILKILSYPVTWQLKYGFSYQSEVCHDYDDEKYFIDLIDNYGVIDTSTYYPPEEPETPENEEEENNTFQPEDKEEQKGIFDDTMGSTEDEYNRGLLPIGADIKNPQVLANDEIDHTEGQPMENKFKTKGTTYPIIRLNDHYFHPDEIQYFSMETGYYKNFYDYAQYKAPLNGFIPTFKLIAVSADPNLLKTDFVKQGDRCSVFFSAAHAMVKSMRCDFTVTNVVTNNMNQNRSEHYKRYIINGELYVPDLRNEEVRYNFNGSSRDAMMDAAKRLRLSFFFCDPEDTDDTMVWCNCKNPELFVQDLTTHAWKNPDSFFESWIDPRYGLSFLNINKLLGESGFDEQIDLTFWINSFGINKGMDNQAEKTEDEKVIQDRGQVKIFTNVPDEDEANTVYHINKWRMVNNAQEIQNFVGLNCKQQFEAVNPGLENNTKYSVEFSLCINKDKFDPKRNPKEIAKDKNNKDIVKDINPFYVLLGPARNMTYKSADTEMKTSETESSNKKEPEKVTNPQSDGDDKTIEATDSNMLSSGNTHKFYEVAYEHNMRNLLQLQKQYLLIELNGANLTILRGEKIPVLLLDLNQAMSILSKTLNNNTDEEEEAMPENDKAKNIQDLITTYIYEAESGWYIIDGIEWVYDPELAETDPTGTCWRTNVKVTRREWPVPGYKKAASLNEGALIVTVVGKDGKTVKKAYGDILLEDKIVLGDLLTQFNGWDINKISENLTEEQKKSLVGSTGMTLAQFALMNVTKAQWEKINGRDVKEEEKTDKNDENLEGEMLNEVVVTGKRNWKNSSREYISSLSDDQLNNIFEKYDNLVTVTSDNDVQVTFDNSQDFYLYTGTGKQVIHGTSDSNFALDLIEQYVQNSDFIQNSTIPLTGLKDYMKELYRLILSKTDNKVKLVSARRWAVNQYGNKVNGNAFIVKNGYYKCMNAIGDVLYFKSSNSRHLYGEAIDIINSGMGFNEIMTQVIMRDKDILMLMYQNGVSAYIEQSTDDLGTTTKHYHIGTDTIKQKEFWASVKAVLGSDKIPGTTVTFLNYMKNNRQTPEFRSPLVTET